MDLTAGLALIISVGALIVSILSWRASVHATRATIFDRRYEVYADAERFVSAWLVRGAPDMNLLGVLVGAWSRSHFLFPPDVTVYLRKIWTDATEANLADQIIKGDAPDERETAIKTKYDLLRYHGDYDKLCNAMQKNLRVA